MKVYIIRLVIFSTMREFLFNDKSLSPQAALKDFLFPAERWPCETVGASLFVQYLWNTEATESDLH